MSALRTGLPGALAVALWLAAPAAHAFTEGNPPKLFPDAKGTGNLSAFTVRGSAVPIGNSLLKIANDQYVNSVVLTPAEARATLTLPNDATVVAAYLFWTASGDTSAPSVSIQFYYPDASGALSGPAPVSANATASFENVSSNPGPAWYARADVTDLVKAHPPTSLTSNGASLIGDYSVGGVSNLRAGIEGGGGIGSCGGNSQYSCQAAFAGWSMVVVYASPTASSSRNITIYDGFVRMDEVYTGNGSTPGTGTTGIIAPQTLGNFTVGPSHRGELSFFAMEGDPQLGYDGTNASGLATPEPPENADWIQIGGADLRCATPTIPGTCVWPPAGGTSRFLQDSANPWGNLFNSTGPFQSTHRGIDLDKFDISNYLTSGQTTLSFQAGSGDGVPNPGYSSTTHQACSTITASGTPCSINNLIGSNGEYFLLGWTMLALDTVAPDFSASAKSVDLTTVAPGDTLTFTIKVINTAKATTVTVQDALPANVTYLAGSTTATGSFSGLPPITIGVPDVNGNTALANGGFTVPGFQVGTGFGNLREVDFTVKAKVNLDTFGQQICNTARVFTPDLSTPVVLTTNPCAHVVSPDLQTPVLTVSVNGAPSTTAPHTGKPGDLLRYTLKLSNNGAAAARGVKVHIDAPPFTKGVNLIAQGDPSATATVNAGGANGTGQIDLSNVTLPANFSIAVIWEVTVFSEAEFIAAGVPQAQIDGRTLPEQGLQLFGTTPAQASDDPATGAAMDPTTVVMRYAADLAGSTKAGVGGSGGFVAPGDVITYTVALKNGGNRLATVSFTDDLPPGVTNCLITPPLPQATCTQTGGANGSGQVTAQGIALVPGATQNVIFTVQVRGDAPNGLQITNTAVAKAPEITVASTLTSNTLTVKAAVDLTTSTKSVKNVTSGNATFLPGDVVEYTITLKNSGTSAATGLVAVDPLPALLAFVPGSIATSPASTTSFDGTAINWQPADLAGGSGANLTYRATIAAAVPVGTSITNTAQAKSAQGATTSPSVTFSVTSSPAFTSSTKTVVDVQGRPGSAVFPGDQLLYTLTLKNTGNAPASNVRIDDVLDPNLTYTAGSATSGGTFTGSAGGGGTVSWALGLGVAPGATITLQFGAQLKAFLVNGAKIDNLGQVSAAELPTPQKTSVASVTVASAGQLTSSTKTAQIEAPGVPLQGRKVHYTLTVTATGNAPANDVVLSDLVPSCLVNVVPQNGGVVSGGALPPTIRWDTASTPALAQVLPGAPVTVSFDAQISPASAPGTVCSNLGKLTSSTAPAADTSTASFTIVALPDLSSSTKAVRLKTDANGDGLYSPGDRVAYSITVLNNGTADASAVTLTDAIPAELLNLTSVPPASGATGNALTFNLGRLAPGASRQLVVEGDIAAGTANGKQLCNQGQVATPEVATVGTVTPAPSDAGAPRTCFAVDSHPLLTFTKALAGNATRRPGDTLVYTLAVANTGTAPATSVVLSDPLDARFTFVSAAATSGGVAVVNASKLTVTWPGALAAGSTFVTTLTVKLPTALDNGTQIGNQATVAVAEFAGKPLLSDDPTTAVTLDPTVVTIISGADLTGATKTVALAPGQPPHPAPGIRPGDVVRYTITITNTGDADAKGVVITDPIDARLSPVTPLPSGGVLAGGAIKWTLPQALKPTDPPLVLTFDALVAKPLANGTTILNQASINATGLATPQLTDDPALPGRADKTALVITSAADLTASTKTFLDGTRSDGTVHPGDTLTFTIQPVDAGDAETTTTVVSDALDAGLDFVSAGQGGVFDAQSRTVTWTLAKVGLDPVVPLALVARVKKPLVDGTQIKNTALFLAPELPAAGHKSSTVAITITSAPDLSGLTKVAQLPSGAIVSAPVPPGTLLTYAIRVPNTGDARASNVVISDALDAGLDQITPLDGGVVGPGGAITWTVAALDPGNAAVVRVSARVKPLTSNGTAIPNQAFALCTEKPQPQPSDDPNTAAKQDPTLVTVVSRPDLSTTSKVVAVPGQPAPGLLRPLDPVKYTITVINSGDTYANDVVVRDPLDPLLGSVTPDQGGQVLTGAIVWTAAQVPALAKLAPGVANAVTLTFTGVVAAAAHDGDVITNQAQLTSDEAGAYLSDDPATAATKDATLITVRFADVRVDKTFTAVTPRADGTLHPGDLLDYTLSVRNRGSFPASAVNVTDTIDLNLVDLAAGQGGVVTPSTNGRPARVVWAPQGTPALAQVAQGAQLALTLRARVKPLTRNQTVIANQATLTAPELNGPVLSDDPTTTAANDATKFLVTSAPDLRATTKSVANLTRTDGSYRPGDQVRYLIAVQNAGDTWATNVLVKDPLDLALDSVAPAPAATSAAGTLQWDGTNVPALAKVNPGDVVTLGFTARVSAGTRDGQQVQNQALLADDEQGGGAPQRSDDPATPAVGDPTVFKVLSSPRLSASIKTVTNATRPGQPVRPGDVLEYELHVLNDGTEAAVNTLLLDAPPPLTTYVAGSTRLNGSAVADLSGQTQLASGLRVRSPRAGTPDGLVLASTGAVPDDTVAVVTFRVKIADDVIGGSLISNQGQLRADRVPQAATDDPTTPQQGDATVIVVGTGPALDLVKTARLVVDQGTPGVADVGDVLEYRLELRNRGTEAVKAAQLTDAIPALTSYLAGSLSLDGAALTDASDTDAGTATALGVNVAVGTIDPGKSRVATFRVTLTGAGTVSNQATAKAAGGLLALSDGDPTLPGEQPTITVVGGAARTDLSGSSKSVTDLNGGDVLPGDQLLFVITLVNGGGKDTTDAVIEDTLPFGLDYLPGSAAGDGTIAFIPTPNAPGIVRASAVTVKAGGRAQLRFRAKVNAQVLTGSLITNTAGVRVTPADTRTPFSASVMVGAAQGTYGLTGSVFHDFNADGVFQTAERALSGWSVLLRRIDQPNAAPLRTQLSDAQGKFALRDLPPASYGVELLSPEGTHFGDLTGGAALAGLTSRVLVRDLPVQVTGALVSGTDRSVVAGARVVLLYDDNELGKTPPSCEVDRTVIGAGPQPLLNGKVRPRAVASACLRAGQQGQATGALGYYRFDLVPSATQTPANGEPARGYRLEVLTGTPKLSYPGSKPAPEASAAGPGPVVPEGDPAAVRAPKWFTRFSVAPGDLVTNNHAVVDPSGLRLIKTATRSTAVVGEIVGYTVTLQNPTTSDVLIDDAGAGGVHFADVLPEDFRYAAGSARTLRIVPAATAGAAPSQACPRLDQAAQGAGCAAHRQGPALTEAGKKGATIGRFLDFGPFDLKAGESLELHYQAIVGSTAKPGDHLNHAVARVGNVDVSNSDSALVRVAQDALFDLTSLIGKVYCESAPGLRTRLQDPGEEGVAGVRIYQDEGWYAETDQTGKFHFKALQPGLHRFKIDPRTIPPGAEVQEGGALTINLTRGLDARANFTLTCKTVTVGPDRFTIKNPPPPPPPPPLPPYAVAIDLAHQEARVGGVLVPVAHGGLVRLGSREAWVEVPAEGPLKLEFGVQLSSGPAPEWWKLKIVDEAGAALGGAEGVGAPPPVVEWTPPAPLTAGATVRAQLELLSRGGTSGGPLLALRLVPPQPPPEVVESFLLRGVLFEESADKATRELGRQLAAPIAKAKAGPELVVRAEVHTSGEGPTAQEQALSDARARIVREALLAAGLAPERIIVRGRGAELPLALSVLERGRQQNRRIHLTLEKPQPPPPAPLPPQVAARQTLDGAPLPAQAQLARGATSKLELQRPDGARATLLLTDPPAAPSLPLAVRVDPAARELWLGTARFALPLLGLEVTALVDGAPERQVTVDAAGQPRALAFLLESPVFEPAGWSLAVRTDSGDEVLSLEGDGAPPAKLHWPEDKRLPQGKHRLLFSVRERGGGEGQAAPLLLEAALSVEAALTQTVLAGSLFPGRGRKLSADGLAQVQKLAPKLLGAAGPGGRFVIEVYADDAAGARELTEARAQALKAAFAAAGLPEAKIAARGRGPTAPVAPNATAPGRRANNRAVLSAIAGPRTAADEADLALAFGSVGGVALKPDGGALSGSLLAAQPKVSVDVTAASGAHARLALEWPFAPAAGAMPAAAAAPVAASGRAPAPGAAALGTATSAPAAPPSDDLPPLFALGLGAPETHAVGGAAPATAATPAAPGSAPAAAPAFGTAAAPAFGTAGAQIGLTTLSASAAGSTGAPPPAAKLEVILPPPGVLVKTESLWIRGSTDPQNKVTANGQPLKLDSAGRFVARIPLRRGEQPLTIISTDPEGNTAVLERRFTVDPDGVFVLLLGEGDLGQGGAQLSGLGDRADFGGFFIKGRAAGVVDGRWDTSTRLGGFFKDVQLAGQFDTSRRSGPTGMRELYDPARFYPVDGDSGLLVQQAASRGPLYLSLKADDSKLVVGNFQAQVSGTGDQLFRYDRALYGAQIDFVKNGLDVSRLFGASGKGALLDSRVTAFAASPDDRARHAHAELRGTGGSAFWLRHSDLVEGAERVRIVVRDAATGIELMRNELQRDVDYSLRAAEGRLVLKQPLPSTADAAFLANPNYTTAMAGNPIYLVVDYDYRGALGDGSATVGARLQETLFGMLSLGGGVVREGYAAGAPYTLGAVNLGLRVKPRTFVTLELAQSSGTDAESYASQDGGMSFGTLGANCLDPRVDLYACKQSGRALHLEAGFELADWLKKGTVTISPSASSTANGMSAGSKVTTLPAMPDAAQGPALSSASSTPVVIAGGDGTTLTLTPDAPNPAPGPGSGPGAGALAGLNVINPDLLRVGAYLDLRDRGFTSSGGIADQGAAKAGLSLRWTPDQRTQVTGRLDQVASDVATSFDAAAGYQTRRMSRRFSALQLQRTLGEQGTDWGKWTFLAEATDIHGEDPSLGSTNTDQLVAGAIYRATPQLTFQLLQEADWRTDRSQYPRLGDLFATTLSGSWKLSDLLYAQLTETVRWSGENATQLGLRTPLFGPSGSVYGNERFSMQGGQLQHTTVIGAEERVGRGSRVYGEYQLDGQASDTAQRAVLGLMNRWELRRGWFLSVGYERAQVLGRGGLGLGGLTTLVPGAVPGATLGGINGVSGSASPALNPAATCTGTSSTAGVTGASGTPPATGSAGTCSTSTLGYNPAGGYLPGATSRDAGSIGLEVLGYERLKASIRAELRADKADATLAGIVPGVADRLHLLFNGDASAKFTEDLGLFARVHLAESRVTDKSAQVQGSITGGVAVPSTVGQARTEARWVELTAGLAFRPVRWDTLAVLFKATHLIDQRPLDLVSGLTDEQVSDVVSISPTLELPWRFSLAEKLAYKHARALLADGPALDTHTWLWVNRLDFHLLQQLDFSGEFRWLKLRGPTSGGIGVGGDGERGVLLEAAWRPTRYSRIGVGWNFTSFSDDELARNDHSSGGLFLRAVGEY